MTDGPSMSDTYEPPVPGTCENHASAPAIRSSPAISGGLNPKRVTSCEATPAATMIPTASGRYEIPVLIGEKCSTSWRYSEMKKNIENSDMPISSPTTFAPRSVRSRKIENGISGSRERDSISTNAISRAAAPARRRSVVVEPQPALTASTTA